MTTEFSDKRIEKDLKVCETATKGPWRAILNTFSRAIWAAGHELIHWMGFDNSDIPKKQHEANVVFIALARTDFPAALKTLRQERIDHAEEVRKLRKAVELLDDHKIHVVKIRRSGKWYSSVGDSRTILGPFDDRISAVLAAVDKIEKRGDS